jgi:hypothetical protein
MAHSPLRDRPFPSRLSADAGHCLGRTCMKWRADGELTALDLRLIRERLGAVDAAFGAALAREGSRADESAA